MSAAGTPADQVLNTIGAWALAITLLFIGLSVVGMFLVLRHVAEVPDIEFDNDVPTPPTFDQDR